ncbi:MAG: T9SS type A sorting domain-containing protein [Bacteroidales bacterium]|nr:T9SS type A sorting domain-containing protein [Bacteroidales bacterium]
MNATAGKLNISHLDRGVYFIRLYLSNDEIINKKIIKQ